MSLSVVIECDGCLGIETMQPTGVAAREVAKAAGWHVAQPGGMDICPACWRKGVRAGPVRPTS